MKVEITRYKSGERAGSIRKQEVRIDGADTWDMGWTIAVIAIPMLKQLRETKYGAPKVEDEDVPDELKSSAAPAVDVEKGETDDNWFKRWDWVMGEMQYAMEKIATYTEDEPDWASFGVDTSPPVHKWEISEEQREAWLSASRAYYARIDNGTRLFGKYFRNLWD